MTSPSRRGRGAEGFLYLEVLVALTLLAFALLGLSGLFLGAMGQNAAAGDLTLATALAQQQGERLLAVPFPALSGSGRDEVAAGAITFERTWTVEADRPHPGLKTVTVQVSARRRVRFGANRGALLRFHRAS